MSYRPHGIDTARSHKYRLPGNELFCRSFFSPLVIAVGAVGILASFPDSLLSLSVYRSGRATVMQQVNQQELDRAAFTGARLQEEVFG